MKNRCCIAIILITLGLLFSPLSTNAAINIMGDGNVAGTGGSGGGGGSNNCDNSMNFGHSVGLKISLVNVSQENFMTTSYFYVIEDTGQNGEDWVKITSSDFNALGAGYVAGAITDGNYSTRSQSSYMLRIPLNKTLRDDIWGFDANHSSVKAWLESGNYKYFYEILDILINGKTGTGLLGSVDSYNSKVENINSETSISKLSAECKKDLVKCSSEENSKWQKDREILSDYRIMLEPIYRYGKDCYPDFINTEYVTLKGIAAIKKYDNNRAGKNKNLTLVAEPYSWENVAYNNFYMIQKSGALNLNNINPQKTDDYVSALADSKDGHGYMVVEIVNEIVPKEDPCDDGSRPYFNYYMFMSEEKKSRVEAKTTSMLEATNTKFRDVEIFENIVASLGNSTTLDNLEIKDKKEIKIGKDNIDDFYKYLISASKTSNKYISVGDKDYYIMPTESGNITDNNMKPTQALTKDASFYKARSISTSNEDLIKAYQSISKGFSFDVIREYKNGIDPIMTSGYIIDDTMYQPAMYRVAYCFSTKQESKCPDESSSPECLTTDNGTKLVFHENDSLNACTLNESVNSGFTLTSNKYCKAACKDDIDISLPTTKSVAAGMNFILDGKGTSTPEIENTRTCVTDHIDYSGFNSDQSNAKEAMMKSYNTWQDYKTFYESLDSRKSETSYSGDNTYVTDTCASMVCPSGRENDDGSCSVDKVCHASTATCSYSYTHWEVSNATIRSRASIPGSEGNEGTKNEAGCGSYDSSESYATYKNSVARDVATKKKEYDEARAAYNKILKDYNECSSWVSEKKTDFNPTMNFTYNDKYSSLFGDNHLMTPIRNLDTTETYWSQNESTNESYTSGGHDSIKSSDKTNIRVIRECSGETCNDDDAIDQDFLTVSYIKRVENSLFKYTLPKLFTKIPSGVVEILNSDVNDLLNVEVLDDQSVPISINTPEGSKPYSIKISNLVDSIRSSQIHNKSYAIDDFKKRLDDSSSSSSYEDGTYTCNYDVINDIYNADPKVKRPNFFYRVVDMSDINPNTRVLGYNWTTSKAEDIKVKMKSTSEDYQKLTNDENTDRFEYILTPAVMRQIRDYNAHQTNGYSDFELKCSIKDGSNRYYCESNFLNCLVGGTSVTGGNMKSCNEIFGNTITGLKYTISDLNKNRELLIDKLNALDRSGGTP